MKLFFAATIFLVASRYDALAERTEIIGEGAEWRYRYDGIDPGTAWKEVDFDDATWTSGVAPLGFGRPQVVTDIGRQPTLTAYFRKQFEVPEELLTTLKRIEIDLLRDDGAIVYLNGVELRRDNLPAGAVTIDTEADKTLSEVDENSYFSSPHSASLLGVGSNTLAVEVHNSSPTSSNLAIDLRLYVNDQREFYGTSRPPCSIDFETPEFPLGDWGVNRAFDPSYAGIEYFYLITGRGGAVLPSDQDLSSGEIFGSTALAVQNSGVALMTGEIDIFNYKDVQMSFDLRTAGEREGDWITAGLEITRTPGFSIIVPWIEIGVAEEPLDRVPFFPEQAAIRYQVPTDPQVPIADWIDPDYDDSGWGVGNLGVGYERNSDNYAPFFQTDIDPEMYARNSSVNIRIPFDLSEAGLAKVGEVLLDVKYDDGFVAWLNGHEIARANAPAVLEWNSQATTQHTDAEAVIYEEFLVEDGAGLLRIGTNVLALRGLNVPVTSSDFLILARLSRKRGAFEEPEPTELEHYRNRFITVQTPLGLVPDDAIAFGLRLDAELGSLAASAYVDNIVVTGTPREPDNFSTTLLLAGIDPEADDDPDGDQIGLLLEYAFGGDLFNPDDGEELLPVVTFDELGFMVVQFRMLAGDVFGDAEKGFEVEDLRYTPELSYDLSNWRDGGGVPPFEVMGEPVANGDGTVTATVRSRRRLEVERERAFFRLLVEVALPPGVVPIGQ